MLIPTLTIIILSLYLIIAFIVSNRKILTPLNFILIGYIFSIMLSMYAATNLNYIVSDITYFIYIIQSSLIFIASLIPISINRNKEKCLKININDTITVSAKKILFLFIIQLSILIIFIKDFNSLFDKKINLQNLSYYINQYRVLSQYGNNGKTLSLSFFVNQLIKLSNAITYCSLFIFASSVKKRTRYNTKVLLLLTLIPTIIIQLMTGSRFEFLIFACFFIVIFFYYRIYKLKLFKIISISILIGITMIGFFLISRNLVGRGNNYSISEYITLYFGNSVLNLNEYLKMYTVPTFNPSNTFYGIYNILNKLNLVELYAFHKPFVYINGINLGNVYGGVFSYIYDFGIFGILIFCPLFGIVSSLIYIKAFENRYKYTLNIWLICYAKIFYAFILDSYNGFFFQNLFSLDFIVELILIIICFYFIYGINFSNNMLKIRHNILRGKYEQH